MKSIWKRFQYYGIGLGIGLMFTFIFFQNRGCSWLPENRVKNAILDNVIVFKTTDIESIERNGFTPDDYIQILNKGDIKFGLSKRDGEPKYYVGTVKHPSGKELKAQFELRKDGFVSLCTPLSVNKVVDENVLVGEARIKRLPLDSTLVSFNERAKCQSVNLGLTERKVLDALSDSGFIDYDQTDFIDPIRPVYFLRFTIDGQNYQGKAIWYKTSIYFTHFLDSNSENCH